SHIRFDSPESASSSPIWNPRMSSRLSYASVASFGIANTTGAPRSPISRVSTGDRNRSGCSDSRYRSARRSAGRSDCSFRRRRSRASSSSVTSPPMSAPDAHLRPRLPRLPPSRHRISLRRVRENPRHSHVDLLHLVRLPDEIPLRRLRHPPRVVHVPGRDRAPIVSDTALEQVRLEPPQLVVHRLHPVRRPRDDPLVSVLERPPLDVGLPVLRLAVHAHHIESAEHLINGRRALAVRDPVAVLLRIPP